MKKGFIYLFFTAVLFFQLDCSKSDSNQNVNSSPTPESTPITEATPTPQLTPLPQFTDAETAFAEGNKLFDANEIDMAIQAYEQAVNLNPDFGEAYFKLGISYAIREKAEEIMPANEPMVEEEPTPTPKPARKGKKGEEEKVRTKKSEKAFENAVKVYKKFLVKNPKDDAAHFYLGRSYEKLDEDKDALKSLREAVKLQPENSEYQTELGKILMKLAQYDEAVRVLKKALELDANNLLAEELLEKAEDGLRRINFAKQEIRKQQESEKNVIETPRQQPKPSPSPVGSPATVPPVKPANVNKM
jgi:tetratricopeptide (TPR) repeat protein